MGSGIAKWGRSSLTFVLAGALLGCSGSGDTPADKPTTHVVQQDGRTLLTREAPKSAQRSSSSQPPPIPDLQPILAAPPPPGVVQRLVTVSVTDPTVPVRDLLIELARKVGVDLDIDAAISGGVILTAKDRPFIDVVDRICGQANLRYRFKDNVLRVEIDSMYHESYNVEILNTQRTITGSITNSSNISTLIQGGGAGGGNNTSTNSIQNTSKSDAWQEIDDNIKQILTNSAPQAQPVLSNVSGSMMSTTMAASSGASHLRAATSAALLADDSQSPSAPAGASDGSQSSGGPLGGLGNSLQKRVMNDMPMQEKASDSSGTPAPAAPPAQGGQARYSINKQAGVVSVFGTSRQQKLVKAYLDKVVSQATAQVLIEAKVVEVALSDQYNTGVDWQALRQNLQGTGFGISSNNPGTSTTQAIPALPKAGALPTPLGGAGFNAAFTTFGGDLAAMINLIRAYGDTRTLSSPRLTVMNNHTAVLKVAQNFVYFKMTTTVTATPTTAGAPASQTATYTSQVETLPIGVVMSVQPSIDVDRNTVTLNLHPTVTAWPGTTVSDPAVALSIASACGNSTSAACSTANINSAITSASVPVVDIREMDSIVSVPSGSVIVMGGLMQEISNKQTSGVPGAEDVPIVGNMFRANTDQTQLTELVIFLKATVVHGTDSATWADKDLYQNYVHDPRPVGF